MKNYLLCLIAVVLFTPGRVEADVWDSATVNDNSFSTTHNSLVHDTRQVHDLGAQPGPVSDADWYKVTLPPYSSFEVIVDGTTGDINPFLQRYASDGTTLLQNSTAIASSFSKRLAWANTTAVNVPSYVRVGQASCGSICTTADQYTISSHETTIALARFNNSGSQVTVLLTQNTSDVTIAATFFYWSPSGVLLTTGTLPALAEKNLNVFNTATFVALQGQGGHITIAHDGAYGSLNVKSVALEASTGFSFDTPGVYIGR